jgi:KUP system potassium uptake protein
MQDAPPVADATGHAHGTGAPRLALVVGAVGVVFGDIGTSPLYTIKEMFNPHFGLVPDAATVKGLLSLGFWSLVIVVTLKYVLVIMRADNDGEGGIMALTALAQKGLKTGSRWGYVVGLLGIFGAALFFGDGMITPPITVLGAVEGLEVISPAFAHWVVPLSLAILTGLFAFQRFGTAKVGRVFGPVMVAWFVALAGFGALNIAAHPHVLAALGPQWAIGFFATHGWHAVLVLGAVVLTVTGGEALYADLGHFGKAPIRWGWFGFVLPALVLNYFGQGALLLADRSAVANPFYLSIPGWAQVPMILLATTAAAVASQAVITGAFSVTAQAMKLGYLPRLKIRYTASDAMGQVYVPSVNAALFVAVVVLTLGFRSTAALATAYGLSVTGTMFIDTLLLAVVAWTSWPDARRWVLPLCVLFGVVDLAFLYANGAKLLTGIGAWVPLAIAVVAFTLMRTWRRGRELLHAEIRSHGTPLEDFVPALLQAPPPRVPGTAIFLSSDPGVVPPALLNNLKHNKVLHARNIFLTVLSVPSPQVPAETRLTAGRIGEGFEVVTIRYGFMENPDVPRALRDAAARGGIEVDAADTTYFTSRETVLGSRDRGMAFWRDRIFKVMHRNAAPASGYFCIPPDRLMEVGSQVRI